MLVLARPSSRSSRGTGTRNVHTGTAVRTVSRPCWAKTSRSSNRTSGGRKTHRGTSVSAVIESSVSMSRTSSRASGTTRTPAGTRRGNVSTERRQVRNTGSAGSATRVTGPRRILSPLLLSDKRARANRLVPLMEPLALGAAFSQHRRPATGSRPRCRLNRFMYVHAQPHDAHQRPSHALIAQMWSVATGPSYHSRS